MRRRRSGAERGEFRSERSCAERRSRMLIASKRDSIANVRRRLLTCAWSVRSVMVVIVWTRWTFQFKITLKPDPGRDRNSIDWLIKKYILWIVFYPVHSNNVYKTWTQLHKHRARHENIDPLILIIIWKK
jgi:hypothetical protein